MLLRLALLAMAAASSAAPLPCLLVGGDAAAAFAFDAAKGATPAPLGGDGGALGRGPGFVAVSATQGVVYATSVNEVGPPPTGGAAASRARDAVPGITTARASCSGGPGGGASFATLGHVAADEPCHVAIHPSGGWVFSASYNLGTVAVMQVLPDSTLGPAFQMSVGPKAHAVNFDSTGRFVFVPCLGNDTVAQLFFDASSGTLSWNPYQARAALPAGAGPRHMVFLPTAPLLAFVLCELDSTVVPFALDAQRGTLAPLPQAPVSTLRAGLPAPAVQAAAEILASADGRFLYATNRASGGTAPGAGDNSVAVLPLTPAGALVGNVSSWATGSGEQVRSLFLSVPGGDPCARPQSPRLRA